MKILHVTSVYPPMLGGIEKVVQSLARAQAKQGHDVSVITSNRGNKNQTAMSESFPINRLKSFVAANTIIIPSLLFKLLSTKKDTVVHLHVAQAFVPEIVWLASMIVRFQYIAHVHLDVPPSGKFGFLLSPYKKYVLSRVLRSAKSTVVFSEEQKDHVSSRYKIVYHKISIIPNGADDEMFFKGKKKLHKRARLLFVGRLSYQKNLKQLLYALEGISASFELTIIGEGDQESELRSLAQTLMLKNVTFTGRLEGSELKKQYQRSDIFVLPSEREGMPLVLLEAMAMSLPIVATDVTGNKDVVEHSKNGILVPYGDSDAMREALILLGSDSNKYSKFSRKSASLARKFKWTDISKQFVELYSTSTAVLPRRRIRLMYIFVPLLILANLGFMMNNTFGSSITLGFFLTVPGFLLLNRFRHELDSAWEVLVLSTGLSIFLMMAGGLGLDSLRLIGVENPFTTINILAILSAITGLLIVTNFRSYRYIPRFTTRVTIDIAPLLVSTVLTILPVLAVAGALRLNNGASNILTMFLFGLIPIIIVALLSRKEFRSIYPYALYMIGLSILLSTSLRGYLITGHDINHEYKVFMNAFQNQFWAFRTPEGDPYNACLSITILPTILAKISSISFPLIFKMVFQIVFALSTVAVYFFARRLTSARIALLCGFLFIAFPAFLSDMPFLNRQEIALFMFSLLLLVNITGTVRRHKTSLSILLILGLVFSHYSSSYVAVAIFVTAKLFFYVINRFAKSRRESHIALLSWPVLLFLVAATFVWNVQITASSNGLQKTVTDSISGLFNDSAERDGFVSYSFLDLSPPSPKEKFDELAREKSSDAVYVDSKKLDLTPLGSVLNNFLDVEQLNTLIHSLVARVLQLMLILGLVVAFFWHKRMRIKEHSYFYALACASFFVLVLVTVLPQLSIDYSVIRLFQQTLPITSIAMVYLLIYIGRIFKSYALYFAASALGVLFLLLSGFQPQLTGGSLPQLSLNNSGAYYDFFYQHKGEDEATKWLNNTKSKTAIFMDTTAAFPIATFPIQTGLLDSTKSPVLNNSYGYLYVGHTNKINGVYRVFINGDLIEYKDSFPTEDRNIIYSNQSSYVYGKRR